MDGNCDLGRSFCLGGCEIDTFRSQVFDLELKSRSRFAIEDDRSIWTGLVGADPPMMLMINENYRDSSVEDIIPRVGRLVCVWILFRRTQPQLLNEL